MKPADRAILDIALRAIRHNVVAAGRGEQLISERVDDYRAAHPAITNGIILLLALHLLRALPSSWDPLTALANVITRTIGRRKDGTL